MKRFFALAVLSTSAFAVSEINGTYALVNGEQCYDKEIRIELKGNKLNIYNRYKSDGKFKEYLSKEHDSLNQGRKKKRISDRFEGEMKMSYYTIIYSNYENKITKENDVIRFESDANNKYHTYSEHMAAGTTNFPNLRAWIARPFQIADNFASPKVGKVSLELELDGADLKWTEVSRRGTRKECFFEKIQ